MIKDGTIHAGDLSHISRFAPVRIMEDWAGKSIREAHASEPVGIVKLESDSKNWRHIFYCVFKKRS